MDDFQGSIAQEDVQFVTEIIREVKVGQNYSDLMVFIEKDKHILDDTGFVVISGDIEECIVTASDYKTVVKGRLLDWLNDFFSAQSSAKVYLFTVCPSVTVAGDWDAAAKTALTTAFEDFGQLAYWKTILISVGITDVIVPAACVDLANLCKTDLLLSSPAMLPSVNASLGTPSSDPVYAAINAAKTRAFMVGHYDTTRNGALLQLSLALGTLNASGTAVGNNMDFVGTSLIDASGPAGTALPPGTQATLKAANIGYFKPVGDSTGAVALVGAKDLLGGTVSADWIVKYCNYVNKVRVANMISRIGIFRNNSTYQGVLLLMSDTIQGFVNSGRLTNFEVTAPDFAALPTGGGTITVPNAWKALYVDNVRKVEVYGQLTLVQE